MNGCKTPKDLTLDKVVEPKSITRIHLDLLGGISGDMFQAAFLDLWPDLTDKLNKDLDDAGFGEKFKIVAEPYNDHCLTGSKVDVICTTTHNAEPSKWGIIRSLIESSKLSKSIKIIAVDIFYKLAVAESKVHGIDKTGKSKVIQTSFKLNGGNLNVACYKYVGDFKAKLKAPLNVSLTSTEILFWLRNKAYR